MKVPGKGTLLQNDFAVADTFVTIAQRMAITPPAIVNGTKDDTDLDDVMKIMSSTILESMECPIKIHYDPASTTHTQLTTLALAGSAMTKNWKVVFNDAALEANRSSCKFPGWVKSFTPNELNVDGNLEADVVVVLTGIPVFTVRS